MLHPQSLTEGYREVPAHEESCTGSWKPPCQEQSCAWEHREPQAAPSTASFCSAQPIPLSWEYRSIPRPGFHLLLTSPLSQTLPAFLASHLLPPSHLCFPPTSVAQCSPRFPRAGRYNLRLCFHQETPEHQPIAPGQPSYLSLCNPQLAAQPFQLHIQQAVPELRRNGLQLHPILMHVLLSGCRPCLNAGTHCPLPLPMWPQPPLLTPSSPDPKRRARLSFSFPSSFTSAV